MISLDEEIKKDRANTQRRHTNRNSSRQRSREGYRSRERKGRYNWDQEQRPDHSRKYHPRNNYQQNQQKTIVKFSQLHYSVTKEQLKVLCQKYGELKFCKIHWDKMGRSKETAVVGYFSQSDAEKAVAAMSHMKFQDMEVLAELSMPERNQRRSSQEDNWRSNSRRDSNRNNRRFNYRE